MKPCRLKIITAFINPDEKESDKEVIHYVSLNEKTIPEYQEKFINPNLKNEEIEEEEKNIIIDDHKEEEEEEEVIIRDKNDLKTKKIKINKEKVYLIDGLFSSTHNSTKKNLFKVQNQIKGLDISQTKSIKEKEKDSQKLRSAKINTNINNKKNTKKPIYTYKWDHKYDNKINTFYNSKTRKNSNMVSPNKVDSEKIFSAPENPFAFNFYKTNKEIDNNIAGLFDYKQKIKDLLNEEPKKKEDRDNIMKENKPKIEYLLKENEKLNFEVGFELNREDELKGEIIILKNQYDILLNQLSKEEIKIKQYQDIIKHKLDHEKIIINKQNEIVNYYNNLNECLEKGDILLVTKPDIYDRFNYLNIKNIEGYNINNQNNENNENNKEIKDINNNNNDIENNNENNNDRNKDNNNKDNKNNQIDLQKNLSIVNEIDYNLEIDNFLHYDIITLLIKGYFINMNLNNVEEIVEKIWNYEKPLQTFESLTEELLMLIDNYISDPSSTFINDHNRNIIMNYFYSFCNCYNYMIKDEFMSIFKDKLGYFIEFNENYLLSKLYKYCNGQLSEFIKIINNLDLKKTGKIGIQELIKALKENNIIISNKYNDNLNQVNEKNLMEQNDIIDIMQLLIIDMKKNKIIISENNFDNENKDNNTERKKKLKENDNKRKINIYELYYENILNIISENSKSNLPLYKGIIKKHLIDNNINSMMDFMESLLLNHDIIINKGLKRYLKSDTFNQFLISNKVIGENETFLIPYNEESLIEINQLVLDIDQAKPLLSNFEENKEKIINDIINDISDT